MTLTLAEVLMLSVSIVSIVASIAGVRQSNRRYRLKSQRLAMEERRLAQGGGSRGSSVSDPTCEDLYSLLSDMVRRIGALRSSGSPDAGARELANVARGLEVRARDRKTALVQDERDTAHARTANTNEMGALERGRCGRGRGVCHAYAP